MTEHASTLKGFGGISREEGADLGTLSAVYFDPENKTVSSFSFRSRRHGSGDYFVPVSEVQLVGRDVILVSTMEARTKVEAKIKPPGMRLNELQGRWVTGMDGKHLGTLVDIDFSQTDWKITELTFADGRHLKVEADEIVIGDEILVPKEYASRLGPAPEGKKGLIERAFGKEFFENTRNALKRTSRRDKAKNEKGKEEESE